MWVPHPETQAPIWRSEDVRNQRPPSSSFPGLIFLCLDILLGRDAWLVNLLRQNHPLPAQRCGVDSQSSQQRHQLLGGSCCVLAQGSWPGSSQRQAPQSLSPLRNNHHGHAGITTVWQVVYHHTPAPQEVVATDWRHKKCPVDFNRVDLLEVLIQQLLLESKAPRSPISLCDSTMMAHNASLIIGLLMWFLNQSTCDD